MKTVFEKKYLDSFSPPKEGERSEFDSQISQTETELSATTEQAVSASETSQSAWAESETPTVGDSASPLPVHSRFSTFFPEQLIGGKRWPGWLASFLLGALIGAVVVYLVMAARPPQTVVKEKVVTKPQIVYRDAPLASRSAPASTVVGTESKDEKQPRAGRRNGARKGRGMSREERKRQLLANLNVGAGNSSKSGDGGGGSLTSSQVNQVVSRNRSSLQYCYERELKKGTAATYGDLKVSFSLNVGTSGTVIRTRISGDGAKLPGLKKCLNAAVKRWIFPAAGSSSAVQFPIIFTPAR